MRQPLKNQFVIFLNKHIFTILHTNSTSRYLPKLKENMLTHEYVCMHAKSLQSCLTLCDPKDCIACREPEIPQARLLERVAMPSSRGSSQEYT